MADGFLNIPKCKKGDVSLVSAEYANKLIEVINAFGGGIVSPTTNVGSMKLAGGRFILDLAAVDGRLKKLEANIATGTGGSGGTVYANGLPFGINDTSPNANYAQVNVRYGTVGNNVPTNVASNISLTTPNSNTSIYINATINNNGAVTGAVVSTGNNVPADTSTQAYKLIGNVRVSGSAVTVIDQSLLFSQEFVVCGRNTTDINNTPGTYYWQVA